MTLPAPLTIAHHPRERLVVFSEDDRARLRQIAIDRQAPKEANRAAVSDKRVKRIGNKEMHYIGLMGEYAVGLVLGIDRDGHANMELDDAAYLAGNRYYDYNLFGTWIECKTLQGFLAFESLKDFVADVAVLCIHVPGVWDRVWVQGWVTRRRFWESNFRRDFNYGERPCMRPVDMQDIRTLFQWCKIRAVMEESLIKAPLPAGTR